LQDGKNHLSENCPSPAISVNLAFFIHLRKEPRTQQNLKTHSESCHLPAIFIQLVIAAAAGIK